MKWYSTFEDSEISNYSQQPTSFFELLSMNIFKDHPAMLSSIEDLAAILDTVSSAGATSD